MPRDFLKPCTNNRSCQPASAVHDGLEIEKPPSAVNDFRLRAIHFDSHETDNKNMGAVISTSQLETRCLLTTIACFKRSLLHMNCVECGSSKHKACSAAAFLSHATRSCYLELINSRAAASLLTGSRLALEFRIHIKFAEQEQASEFHATRSRSAEGDKETWQSCQTRAWRLILSPKFTQPNLPS